MPFNHVSTLLGLDKAWGVSSSESEEQVSDEDSDGSSMDEMASDEEEVDGRSLGYDEEDGEDMVDSTLGFNLKASMMERNTGWLRAWLESFSSFVNYTLFRK